MLSRAQQRQAEAEAWLSKHKGWDNDIPDPQSLAQPLFICPENEDGREKYDIRHAVPEPEAWLPELPGSPKKRKRSHKKAVNSQLVLRSSEQSSEQDCFDEVEEPNAAVAARINRKRDYALSQYKGKYRDVLSLLLLGLPTKRIADNTGKTTRRIRQIVNGNTKRGTIGLRQFITDLCEPPPVDVGRVQPTGAGGEYGGI